MILDGHQYELMSSPAVLVKGVDLAPSVLLQPKLKFETLKYAGSKSEALKLSISLDDVGDGRRVIGYQLEHKRLKRPPPPSVDESGEAVVLEKVMSREEEKAEFAREAVGALRCYAGQHAALHTHISRRRQQACSAW